MVQQSSAIPIFCCHAHTHEDETFLEKLKNHLNPLQRQNVITLRDDSNIIAGENRDQELKRYLDDAKIILLLISSDFTASYYYHIENMQYILERHIQEKAIVVPVLLRRVNRWGDVSHGEIWLRELKSLPNNGEPVKNWNNLDDALKDVAEGIEKIVRKLRGESPLPSGQGDDSSPENDDNNHVQPPNSPGPGAVNRGDPSQKPHEELKKLPISRRTVITRGLVGGGLVGGTGVAMVGGKFLLHMIGTKAPLALVATNPTPSVSPTSPAGQYLNAYLVPATRVRSVAWVSDGYIVSGDDNGTTQKWMWNAQKSSFSCSVGHVVYAVAPSPDKRNIATANSDSCVRIWDAHLSIKLFTHSDTNEVYAVAWSPDGKYIAYGGRDMIIHIRRWQDPPAAKDVCTYNGHKGQIYTIEWSPDGKYIASAGTDKTVHVWKPLNGELIYSYEHDNNVYAVAWSPDGIFLASGSTDTTNGGSMILKVWDFTPFFAKKTPDPQLTAHVQNVPGVSTIYSLMWSPKKKGHLAWAGSNGFVQVWDNLGNRINSYNGLTSNVLSVAWSSDGKSIAAGGESTITGGKSTPILIWNAN